jgi:spermidine synthase
MTANCQPRRSLTVVALWALLGPLLLLTPLRQVEAQPAGLLARRDGVLETIDSEYNSIRVEKQGSVVSLTFGHRAVRYVESAIDWSRRDELIVPYTRMMTVALAYGRTPVRRIGLVGLGGGRTISYLVGAVPEASADVAELDPAVVDVARRYFGVETGPRLRVHQQDGRVFLNTAKDKFDLVLLDAYRGPFVPFHLTTREFYQMIKARLAPGGVVAQNVEPSTMLFDSAYQTMKAVFDQVDAFEGNGNIVLVGYAGKQLSDVELGAAATVWQSRYRLRYDLRQLVQSRRAVKVNAAAKVLTDDFAPVEDLKAIRHHNEKHR